MKTTSPLMPIIGFLLLLFMSEMWRCAVAPPPPKAQQLHCIEVFSDKTVRACMEDPEWCSLKNNPWTGGESVLLLCEKEAGR